MDRERDFMDRLLSRDFDGVEALRQQWAAATVHSSCDCGCGSFGFELDADAPRSSAENPLPVSVEIVDAAGEVCGGIVVLVRQGVLDDVDVYSVTEEPLRMPPVSRLRWS